MIETLLHTSLTSSPTTSYVSQLIIVPNVDQRRLRQAAVPDQFVGVLERYGIVGLGMQDDRVWLDGRPSQFFHSGQRCGPPSVWGGLTRHRACSGSCFRGEAGSAKPLKRHGSVRASNAPGI